MKKLKQGLLLAVLLLLGAYVTIPLIKQQRENWRTDKLNELYNSTGYDYLYTESIPILTATTVMLGVFQDGDGYKLVTACVPAEGEGGVCMRAPLPGRNRRPGKEALVWDRRQSKRIPS